jgi:tetratricopeptide (TPR) repeat protein
VTATNKLHDRYGLALGTRSAIAADAYVEGVDRLLSLNAGTEAILRRAIEADEAFALPHAALAMFYRFQGEAAQARDAARRGLDLAAGLSRREQQHLAFVEAFVGGNPGRALDLAREHLDEFPRDALVLYQVPFVISFRGGGDRRQLAAALVEQLAPAYGDDWWFAAFASIWYQEVDQFDRARQLAMRSLELYPRNASAVHPLAHVFYETDDHTGGVGFLSGWLPEYDRAAPYHCHLSWHQALSELAMGRYGRAMALYEDAISPATAGTLLSFFDAASLLWRYEIYGCAGAPLPWREVRDLGRRLFPRPGVPFADGMLALACAGAGDEAGLTRLIDGLRDQAASGHPIAGTIVLPLVEAIAAFGRADYQTAVRKLEPLTGEIVQLSGTNAQREVFEDTLLEAYLRAGQFDRAEVLLRKRLNRRPSTRDYIWLGRAQAGTGRADEARHSLQAARARWFGTADTSPELVALERLLDAVPAHGSTGAHPQHPRAER